MFDIVITSAPATPFSTRVASTLREARMRVVHCEVGPNRPPPDALRVDAAVACAPAYIAMLDIARSVRALLDGPPPVVGISGGAPSLPPAELVQTLPDDVAGTTLVAHVQRAAAQAERRRSKVVLKGDLDDVGLDNLLGSLAARGKTCFVRMRAGSRRAEVTLEQGRTVHVRADGVDASSTRAETLAVIAAYRDAQFEVVSGGDDVPPPRSQPLSAPPRPSQPPLGSGGATEVALAAAGFGRLALDVTRRAEGGVIGCLVRPSLGLVSRPFASLYEGLLEAALGVALEAELTARCLDDEDLTAIPWRVAVALASRADLIATRPGESADDAARRLGLMDLD